MQAAPAPRWRRKCFKKAGYFRAMPKNGYSTLGLKPNALSLLESLTDTFYPGMFLPSTLIMLMNEVRRGSYQVGMHPVSVSRSGRYKTLTIRSDVREWLEEMYAENSAAYKKRYNTKCFAHFVSYFVANVFKSKFEAQHNVIKLKESDFKWLHAEYQKHRKAEEGSYDTSSFERFADSYVNDLLGRVKAAREMLAT